MRRLWSFDILEGGIRRLRRDLGAAAIPLVLGVATLLVGGVSWGIFLADKTNISTSAKHSDLTGVFHRTVYGALRTVSDFAPSVWNVNEGNYGTDFAAILGAAAFYASLFLIAANIMSETARRIAARYLYRNHVVVIGETPLASRVTEVWRRRVSRTLQVVAARQTRPPRGSAQVRSVLDERIVARFGLPRAACVFIDLGDDMATLALAYDLLSNGVDKRGAARGGAKGADWTLVVRDRTLADHFAGNLDAPAGATHAKPPRIRYFAPERAVVRHFLAARPLFRDEACARGIHALVIGTGAAADELIQAIFQTGLIAGCDKPRVSVVTPQPAKERSTFFSRRPGLIGEVDVAFLPPAALDDFEPVARLPDAGLSAQRWDRTLYDRDLAAPVNVVFLMGADTDANSRSAIELKAVQEKTGRLRGKLFGCNTGFDDAADRPRPETFERRIDGYETFGLDHRFLDEELCTTTRRQTLAYALHENYRRAAPDPDAVPVWDGLSESLRRANEDAADHCLAKLHMLGFDVAGIPSGAIPRLREADYDRLREALCEDPLTGRARDIVFLEHDRWMLERRFEGWVFGARRDDRRKIHPLLVPWDALAKSEQDKDRDQVEALLACLQARGDRRVDLRRGAATATAPP